VFRAILRFFETNGEACRARLTRPPEVVRVRPVDLLERPVDGGGELPIRNGRVEMDVAPFEIVTLELTRVIEPVNTA